MRKGTAGCYGAGLSFALAHRNAHPGTRKPVPRISVTIPCGTIPAPVERAGL
jgi:hypothetical protein